MRHQTIEKREPGGKLKAQVKPAAQNLNVSMVPNFDIE